MKALTEKEQMVMGVLWEHRHCIRKRDASTSIIL